MTTTLDSPATAEAPTRTRRKSLLRKLVTSREMGVALVLILVIGITTLKNPAFLVSGDGFRDRPHLGVLLGQPHDLLSVRGRAHARLHLVETVEHLIEAGLGKLQNGGVRTEIERRS